MMDIPAKGLRGIAGALLLFLVTPAIARADFALRDGDTVAFLGDSITAARGYSKIVEHYTLMRFPERNVRFFNAGEGGDTATKCLQRLDRDVFSKNPTVLTVAFGINDIGWGTKADDEHKKLYLDGIRTIIGRCREHKVRPVICSPAITAEEPDKAEKGYLQTMTDEGLALARSLGAETIDLQRGMREIQRRLIESNATTKPEDQVRLHVKDGIHLEEIGQVAMAYAMLKGLGAPEEVSSATLGYNGGATESKGCVISEVVRSGGGIAFTRLDEGLPLSLGPFTAFQFRWVPMQDGLNRYFLTVRDLPEGEYEIKVDGRSMGKTSAADLARGQNISGMTSNGWEPGGPWECQSCVVKELVDARDKLWMGGVLQERYLSGSTDTKAFLQKVAEQDSQLVELQRRAASPTALRFELIPVK